MGYTHGLALTRGHQFGVQEAQETEEHLGKHGTWCLEGHGWRPPERAWGRLGVCGTLVCEERRTAVSLKAGFVISRARHSGFWEQQVQRHSKENSFLGTRER